MTFSLIRIEYHSSTWYQWYTKWMILNNMPNTPFTKHDNIISLIYWIELKDVRCSTIVSHASWLYFQFKKTSEILHIATYPRHLFAVFVQWESVYTHPILLLYKSQNYEEGRVQHLHQLRVTLSDSVYSWAILHSHQLRFSHSQYSYRS